jgi:hypothetical protein
MRSIPRLRREFSQLSGLVIPKTQGNTTAQPLLKFPLGHFVFVRRQHWKLQRDLPLVKG